MSKFLLAIIFLIFFSASAVAGTVIKVVSKDLNPGRLSEELAAQGLWGSGPLTGIGWAGFARVSERRYAPEQQRTIQAGELQFQTSRDLTALEEAALDAALTAHDAANLSAEQVRQDQDTADLQRILSDFRNWDALTEAERVATMKLMLRILIRRERGGAL